MQIQLIKKSDNFNTTEEFIPELWPNKKEWVFYLHKSEPMSGEKPNVETFINIEKQYAIFNKSIKSLKDEIPESEIDIALDAYNKKLYEWENGYFEMKSVLIKMHQNDIDKINRVESSAGFNNWIQSEKVIKIKNYINNICTI